MGRRDQTPNVVRKVIVLVNSLDSQINLSVIIKYKNRHSRLLYSRSNTKVITHVLNFLLKFWISFRENSLNSVYGLKTFTEYLGSSSPSFMAVL